MCLRLQTLILLSILQLLAAKLSIFSHHCIHHSAPIVLSPQLDVVTVTPQVFTEHSPSLLSLLVSPPVKQVTYFPSHSQDFHEHVLLTLANRTQVTIHFEGHGDDVVSSDIHAALSPLLSRFCNQNFPRALHSNSSRREESPTVTLSEIRIIDVRIIKHPDVSQSFEEYVLNISRADVSIATPSLAGLSNALSTLSQLLDSPVPLHSVPVQVHDFPAHLSDDIPSDKQEQEQAQQQEQEQELKEILSRSKQQRELALDVSLYFLPIDSLFRVLDGMAMLKLNLLRLQLVGHSSLPIEFDNTTNTSFSSHSVDRFSDGSPAVYTAESLRHLASYASELEINILPVISIPTGVFHSTSHLRDVTVNCSQNQMLHDDRAINPLNPRTLLIVNELFQQVSSVLPFSTMALHMDLTSTSQCWISNALTATPQSAEFIYYQFARNLSSLMSSYNKHLEITTITGLRGVDFTNIECHVLPSAALSPGWGDQTKVHVKTLNFSNMWVVEQKPETLRFELAAVRLNVFLKRQGLRMAEAMLFTNSKSSNSTNGKGRKTAHHSSSKAITFLQEAPLLKSLLLQHESIHDRKHTHWLSTMCPAVNDRVKRLIPFAPTPASSLASISERAEVSLKQSKLQTMFFNVALGGRDRISKLKKFLGHQASRGMDIVGLCELNGWQESRHDKIVKKRRHNGSGSGRVFSRNKESRGFSAVQTKRNASVASQFFPVMREISAESGFAFSFVTDLPSHPFNLGVVASVPFEVVGVHGLPYFQRGCLHVYFEVFHLHVFITHLHAHNSTRRVEETLALSAMVEPIIRKNIDRVLVMGDMNNLFQGDSDMHHTWSSLFETSNHNIVMRLKQKFCYDSSSRINYQPLQNLLNAGLKESCTSFCRQSSHHEECYKEHCAYSEPTRFNPEWSGVPGYPIMPRLRVDFIFHFFPEDSYFSLHDKLTDETPTVGRMVVEKKTTSSIVAAGVIDNDITQQISDHFPVRLTFSTT